MWVRGANRASKTITIRKSGARELHFAGNRTIDPRSPSPSCVTTKMLQPNRTQRNPALGKNKTAGHESEGIWLENDHLNLNFEYDLPWAQLVSSTTWAMSEHYWDLVLDGFFVDVMPFHYNETLDQDAFVQELRLVSSHGGKVEWLAGLFYLNRQTDFLGSLYTSREFLDSEAIDYSGLPHPRPLAGVSMDIVSVSAILKTTRRHFSRS